MELSNQHKINCKLTINKLKNRFHAGMHNTKINRHISFTLSRIKLRAPTYAIVYATIIYFANKINDIQCNVTILEKPTFMKKKFVNHFDTSKNTLM